jgi:eukaryotic-like serine/threonine-protein kinase
MELIRGLNLEELVKRFGPQPAARVRHIWMGVLRSLDEAHAVGLTHRDIKPSNILLARVAMEHDFVKVVDFGLAKVEATEGQTQLTMETSTVGTPAYMAPELARGDEDQVDGRADLYAMGCVAYYLLTGKTVFEAPTGMALLVKHLQEPVVPPSERVELPVPQELERMVMWCLEKKAENRPQSAGQLLGALEQVEMEEWPAGARKRWWETHLPSLA